MTEIHHNMIEIHPTAIVDPKAELAEGVKIGPYSIIGPEVKIGAGTEVENHVTIKGDTTIGSNNRIGAYSSIGFGPQDKQYRDYPGRVIIGDDNDIREYVTVHLGTGKEDGLTQLGSGNQIFVHCHFAHDTRLGDNCMLANSTTLAGHVKLGSRVVTGGFAGFHQFTRVGDFCMVGAFSGVYQDIVPYSMSTGSRAKIQGLNTVGLQRNGFDSDQIARIQGIFDTYFSSGLVPGKALEAVEKLSDGSELYSRFIDFVKGSKRGLITR